MGAGLPSGPLRPPEKVLSPMAIIGIGLALISALVWGSGDFTGGLAARRSSQYQVVALSAFSGLAILLLAAVVWRESFPSLPGILFSALGGAGGALGIAALYRALSLGHNASVAPTAAVIGAALPVVSNALIEGPPGTLKLIGFGVALLGICLVSLPSGPAGKISRQGFLLACLAGVGFGCFFIFLGQVEQGKIFTPLIVARTFTLLVGILLVKWNRLPLPFLRSNGLALLAGILDAGGNLFYILAKQYTRLDIAAVISSLYPASTVLLAGIILKERISPVQRLGVLVCLLAIAMITV